MKSINFEKIGEKVTKDSYKNSSLPEITMSFERTSEK